MFAAFSHRVLVWAVADGMSDRYDHVETNDPVAMSRQTRGALLCEFGMLVVSLITPAAVVV